MTESPYQRNRFAYDQVAGQFAAANAEVSGELQRAAQVITGRLAPGSRLLDLGCGAGRDLAWMQERQPRDAGACYYGADLSFGMLLEARRIVHAPLLQANLLHLPFTPGSFGGIWCVAVMLHIPRAEAPLALAEMARVLSSGGFLYIAVQKGSGEGWERTPYNPPVERFFARYEEPEMIDLLSAAGFGVLLNHGEEFGHRHWLWFEAQRS